MNSNIPYTPILNIKAINLKIKLILKQKDLNLFQVFLTLKYKNKYINF